MLNRWCNEIFDINLALSKMRKIIEETKIIKRGRGARPKRDISVYALVIALKEYDKRTLRGAEEHITRLICNERIDHSVISYYFSIHRCSGSCASEHFVVAVYVR